MAKAVKAAKAKTQNAAKQAKPEKVIKPKTEKAAKLAKEVKPVKAVKSEKKKKTADVHGWVVIDKPKGMGSTDVVTITRNLFKAEKNGHVGTLDPFATGVLPIAFGEATKLIPYVTEGRKEYEFVVQWGSETTTDDIDGEVTKTSEKTPERDEIKAILPKFTGKIKQTPPPYSAIKVDGKRAYELAREGKKFTLPDREVEIFDLKLLGVAPKKRQAKFWVECSKGTYIRTLGKDLAKKLGTKGHLAELRRTKNACFSLEDALVLEINKKKEYVLNPDKGLLDVSTCLRDIAVIAVSESDATKLRLGQGVSPKAYKAPSGIAIAKKGNELVAIVRIDERKIAPVRVFNWQ